MTVTIDGTQIAQIAGSNNASGMTYDQLGTGFGGTSPDVPASGEFPFTGTITSLTITEGTLLAGFVAPSNSSNNQLTFTPPALGTYTVDLSSTDSSGQAASTSQTIAVTDVAPSPTISGLPASGAVNQTYTLVASVTDPVPLNTAAGFNDVWSEQHGPGPQAVAASNLVLNGSNPITLPSGLIHNATSLAISVTFQTTGDGVILGYQDQPLGSTPGNYVPLLYIGTNGYLYLEFSNASSKAIESATKLNDGQLHTVTIQWNGSLLSYTLDAKTSGTISGFTPEMLNMTYDELGSGYAGGYPAAPSGTFPFTGTIKSLTITSGTALQGVLNPTPSAGSQASFTPFTSGTYTIGLSSTESWAIRARSASRSPPWAQSPRRRSPACPPAVPRERRSACRAPPPRPTRQSRPKGSATSGKPPTPMALGFRQRCIELQRDQPICRPGQSDEINFGGQITLDAWIMPESTGGLQDIIAHGYQTSPTNAEDFLKINGGYYQVGSWNGGTAMAQAAIPASDIGQWVNLVGVYNGTQWILYRDGVQVATSGATTQGALPVSNTDWAIGAEGGGTGRFFQGEIDDASIWNVGLSASAVSESHRGRGPGRNRLRTGRVLPLRRDQRQDRDRRHRAREQRHAGRHQSQQSGGPAEPGRGHGLAAQPPSYRPELQRDQPVCRPGQSDRPQLQRPDHARRLDHAGIDRRAAGHHRPRLSVLAD